MNMINCRNKYMNVLVPAHIHSTDVENFDHTVAIRTGSNT